MGFLQTCQAPSNDTMFRSLWNPLDGINVGLVDGFKCYLSQFLPRGSTVVIMLLPEKW